MTPIGFDDVLAIAREHYSTESLAHAERVADVAAELAEHFGIDVPTARLAGLLHDWARDLSTQELLEAAERFDIEVAPLDRQVPYLLHATVGAALLAVTFAGLPKEVTDAVRAHTYGTGHMSPLEKVVYVADMIEPARDFDAAPELRRAAAEVSLDELFRRAYARSVEHLIATKRHIHPETVAVWNAQVADGSSS